MAATAHTTHVPLEVYLSTAYEPDAEYVNGVIEERPKGEFDNSSWQHALELWFAQHAREWGIRVRPELRVQVAEGQFPRPGCDDSRSQPTSRTGHHSSSLSGF